MKLLDHLEEWIITLLMGSATAIIFAAVVHRYLAGLSIPGLQDWLLSLNFSWAQELCIIMFVWMAKFGAAYGVRIGIHVGVDVLVQRLEGRAKKIVTVIAMSGGILFTGILVWIGTDFVYHVWLGGQTSPDLEIKMWIVYLAVPLGSALMCFRFIQALYWYLTTGYIAHHDLSSVEGVEEEAAVALLPQRGDDGVGDELGPAGGGLVDDFRGPGCVGCDAPAGGHPGGPAPGGVDLADADVGEEFAAGGVGLAVGAAVAARVEAVVGVDHRDVEGVEFGKGGVLGIHEGHRRLGREGRHRRQRPGQGEQQKGGQPPEEIRHRNRHTSLSHID